MRPPLVANWLMRPLRAAKGVYLRVAVAAAVINLFALVTALFSMTVYDRVVPNNATNSLVVLSIGVGIVILFDFVLKTLRAYFIDVAGAGVDREVGGAIFGQLLAMKLSERRGSTGSFAGSLREFETLRDFFASATLAAVVDVPFILLFMGVIALIGGWLVMVPLAVVPLVLLTGALIQPSLDRLTARVMKGGLTKQGVLVESVAALETVKSTHAGALLAGRWERAVDDHAAVSTRQRALAGVAINVAGTAQNLSYVGVIVFGVALIAGGHLTMGGMIACSILAGRAVAPLGQIANLLTRVSHTRAAYRELDRLMSAGGEMADDRDYLRRDAVEGALEFRDVTFRYPGTQAKALAAINLVVRPGERVGVLGRTGSGKSTLTRLALGLYEPAEGAVLVDGSDVRQLHPDDLRAHVGAVLQEVTLLSGSVKDNIALGRPGIDDAEVLRAAKLAGVHDFLGATPGGYDLRLADRGEGLSGGQRQAIAVARALAGRPPVLLLDEPTSAMDNTTEAALIARLAPEVAGRTLLLVTHRPTMLRLVERIVILDGGRVVADGPRDAVLRSLAGKRAAPADGAPAPTPVAVAGGTAAA